MKKIIVALTLGFAMIACGAQLPRLPIEGVPPRVLPTPTPTPTPAPFIAAAQVFNNHVETWEFQNGYGDLTWIDIAPQPDGSTVWHYTKNADRAYWTPGAKNAELFFTLVKDASGSWYNTTGHVLFPFGAPWDSTPQDFIYTNVTTPGLPRPYLILGDSGITLDTTFTDFGTPNTRWTTKTYTEQINTPVFSGFALVSEQWEGACSHEKWYFAPGYGLIEVIPFDTGNCQVADPLLVMKRIN